VKLVPQTRRSTWTTNGITVVSAIVCVGRALHSTPGCFAAYRPLYTVEVEFGEKRLRVRSVPNADALAWEQRLVYVAFVELGAIRVNAHQS
jgi:hypothetical protein